MPTTTTERRKHFSMIREFHLADFFTLGNAACGMAAVFCAMTYVGSPVAGPFLRRRGPGAGGASIFDVLDGRVARWRHNHSALGRELDSLADIISFGVAPAALGFAAGLARRLGLGGADLLRLLRRKPAGPFQRDRREPLGRRGQGCLLRRHADSHQRPAGRHAGLGRVAGPAGRESLLGRVDRRPWDLHPLALLFVLSGTLMISKTLRIPKL